MTRGDQVGDVVERVVREYSAALRARHLAERDDPDGTLNSKIHNVFVARLGPQVQFWSAMSRSLDSSFGKMLERMALEIAEHGFTVHRSVDGPLSAAQAALIAELCEDYRTGRRKPSVSDYEPLRALGGGKGAHERHVSDFHLVAPDGTRVLIELKAGGDLDNKKAAGEKQAILTQYAILSNVTDRDIPIELYFATAYNKFGEGQEWRQNAVRAVFAPEELLIGRDFWDFVCGSSDGHRWVLDAFERCASELSAALHDIQKAYGLT